MQDAADSLITAADSAAQDADSVTIIDSTGIGALNESVGNAVNQLAQGDVQDAAGLIGSALWDFGVGNVLPALAVGLAFYLAYKLLVGALSRGLGKAKKVDDGVKQLIVRALRIVIVSFATITILGQLGINVAALVAGLGIAGIALGFAAKDTLENFIAGVTILLDRPFRIGDNIEIQDTFGTVVEIALRSTRIRTPSNEIAILPNSKVITERIINHTRLRNLRVEVPFGIAYKESPAQARATVLALAEGDDRLHPDHQPEVVVTELGDSSVNMELRLFLKNPKQELAVFADYQEKVFDALTAAGIEIPFPHLQLFNDEAKAFKGSQLVGGNGA